MEVITLEVPSLGNRCYLAHDGRTALVVDPPRDPGAVEDAAETAGLLIGAVADTHVHNDYVSGALALARRHGADYFLAADEQVGFERVGVRGGDVLPVGRLDVAVLATPGHTRHHQAFLVRDHDDLDDAGALFSGGSLLDGTVGRTDLVAPELTVDLARRQWDSARLLGGLDPAVRLHPTHGYGSFCAGSTPTTAPEGTDVGDQQRRNPALTTDREAFVAALVAGFGPVPTYYAHMATINRSGGGRSLPHQARPVTSQQVTDAILRGSWVVDLRSRSSFAAGHLPGSISVEYGDQFATYVGWLVPWDDDLMLLCTSPEDVSRALHDLAAIGIDGPSVHLLDAAGHDLTARYRRADWREFREHPVARIVVDVRQRDEYDAAHLPGAVHLPIQDVEVHGRDLPAGQLWVHCRSGYRAGIAASLLHRMGRDVVHVDDSWDRVGELAIPTTNLAA